MIIIQLFNKYKFFLIGIFFMLYFLEERFIPTFNIFKYLFVGLMYCLIWMPIIEIKLTSINKEKLNLYLILAVVGTIMVTGFVLEQ